MSSTRSSRTVPCWSTGPATAARRAATGRAACSSGRRRSPRAPVVHPPDHHARGRVVERHGLRRSRCRGDEPLARLSATNRVPSKSPRKYQALPGKTLTISTQRPSSSNRSGHSQCPSGSVGAKSLRWAPADQIVGGEERDPPLDRPCDRHHPALAVRRTPSGRGSRPSRVEHGIAGIALERPPAVVCCRPAQCACWPGRARGVDRDHRRVRPACRTRSVARRPPRCREKTMLVAVLGDRHRQVLPVHEVAADGVPPGHVAALSARTGCTGRRGGTRRRR